ncbi:CRISPR-associated helicase Cas3' [Candidatus Nitrotoga arctica]|uniref:CRISPR-associated helicase Cas3, protein n=1 Tax=Candidatus Nitrotoga arctica TaxID=453162 RepID=A0ABM8YYA7_9PROT|nr:CRISPR-associated helicase Cas3' [Candidatus Nitrotoga arctica]CAG9932377.1 CRISPR-associated helicase Cas3, protein [Candidatus Nitrotoga arctica]
MDILMVAMHQRAFGKLERDNLGVAIRWHPLVDHMIDVAACFECLSTCHSIRRAMKEAAGRELDERDIARLSVLVFLHDIGKANSGFQAKRWKNSQDIPKGWPLHAGHGIEAIRLFETDAQKSIAPLIEKICAWGDAGEPLLIASISHHGRPIKKDNPGDWNRNIWKAVAGTYAPADVLTEIGKRAEAIFPQAFESGGEPLPNAHAFAHLFAGLVQLADWLGSDTNFFPFSEKGEDRAVTAKERARKAIAVIGLDADNWRSKLNACAPNFAATFGILKPHPIQDEMSDGDLGPLVILESETGSGKTEAALWRFVHLFRACLVDSLYFALPTRVAASQVYDRVQAAIKNLWPENPPLTIRALPGYVNADGGDVTQLPNFKVLWSDHPDDAKAHQRWAAESAKRFLAAPIAVGTIDQALLGALQVRHAHMRHAMLARSFLVVDEVHASDPYMTVLLEHLLKAHINNGGQALLLSATLGSSARNRYLALAPGVKRPQAKPMTFEAACAIPYPAISDQNKTRAVEGTGNAKRVTWTTHDIIDAPDKIATLAIDAAKLGAKVLVIRNTVPTAIATLMAIEEGIPDKAWLFTVNGIPTLHHSRFSRQDRPVMDKAVEAQLGRNRPVGACIVVGTQTLEQSLDIDADVLITDLCPMDVLLQRVGRLHRHRRPDTERPEKFQSAQAWVLTPARHDLEPLLAKSKHGLGMFHNGGGVYTDLRVLEATRALLAEKPSVLIPDDNRYLVEAATHPDKLDCVQVAKGEAWQKLGQKVEGDTGARQTIARLQALDFEQAFGEQEFPNDVQIATRLGAQDRILNFNLELPSPFGQPLKELPIRYHLLPKGLSPDAEPSDISQTETSLTFRLGDAQFRYTRLGLERLKDD